MKVDELGIGQSIQYLRSDVSLMAASKNKIRFYSFLSICQIDSQKIRFISLLASFYSLLQNAFISFWPHLKLSGKGTDKFDFLRTPPVYEENLTNAFFIYSTDKKPEDLYLYSYILFFISIFFFFASFIGFCIYQIKHIINFQLILCFNFFVQFICQVIVVPIGFQTGWLISKIIYMKELDKDGKLTDEHGSIAVFTSIVVLNAFLFLIVNLFTIANNFFNANSILIVDTHIVSSNFIFHSLFKLFPSIILFFSNILPLFNTKLTYFIVSLHMAFCICMTVWCFWLPYGIKIVNSITSSFLISMLVSDIICFTKLNTKWYRYVIFIGCFIFFYFLMNFFIKLRIKSILKRKKKKDNEENLNPEIGMPSLDGILASSRLKSSKFQPFGDPTISIDGLENLSVSKLLFVLRVAIMTKSQLFLEGQIVDYISSKIETDEDKIIFCSLICYFSDFQSIFFSILTSLKRARLLPLNREFQLYQLRRYDACCHLDMKIEELNDIINETKSLSLYLRSLWLVADSKSLENDKKNANLNIKLKTNMFTSFDGLSRSINNCENNWKSIISFYPNNIQVSEEYSKFLIECCGDFIQGAEWKTISSLLKEGKTFKFNPAHVSFLRSYPHYAKQIYPKRSLFKNMDDIDIHTKLDNISTMIDMPETRFEFQRSTNTSYPISIYIFLALSIVSLCFTFVYWIYAIFTFGHFEHITESLYFIVNTAFLAQQISKNLINAIMDFGQLPEYNLFPIPEEIFSAIYENNVSDRIDEYTARSLLQLNGIYSKQLAAVSERGMGLVNYLHNSSLEQIEKGNDFQVVLDVFYNNSLTSTYYLSKDESITSVSNLQSYIISFFTYYFTMSYDTNHTYVNDPEFFHATNAGAISLDQVDYISQSILHNNQILLDKADFKYSTQIYILSAIYIAISIVFVWINFFTINHHFQKICESLCSFPKNVLDQASNPIIKNENDLNDFAANVNQSNFKNFVIIALIVSTIINLVLFCTIFLFHFIYETYKNQFVAITDQTHYYSLETCEVIEVLYSVMAGVVYGQLIPKVDEMYKKKISSTLNKFIETHEACGNLSYEFDCGISQEYVDIMNDLKNLEKCPKYENKSFHETIACLSEESMINAFIDLTKTLESNANDPFLLHTNTFKQYIHFVLSHVYYDVRNFGNYIVLGALEKQVDYIKIIQLFGSLSIVVSFIGFVLNVFIFFKIRRIYKTLFAFISRVLPSDLVLNDDLMKSLLNIKTTNKQVIENEGTSFLVQESSSPIAFLDRSTLIQFVNNAFIRNFGYEANFIVGQPISILIGDESVLYFIDTLKFFGSKEISVKTVKCAKGNGNFATYDITFIPIHNISKEKMKEKEKAKEKEKVIDDFNSNENDEETKNSFINRIALVFVDKTFEISLMKKCNTMKHLTEKIANSIYPPSYYLYMEGCLRMCSICLIKIPNVFSSRIPANKVLAQRANVYNIIYDKLKIYPLLSPFYTKNGIFAAVGCKKNDPTELAIECLNFVFNIISELVGLLTVNPQNQLIGLKPNQFFFAAVETGGEILVNWSGDESKKSIVSGELIERAMKVLDNANLAGTICVSNATYQYIMQHDYSFTEKPIPEEICGCNSIYSIESNHMDDIDDSVNKESSAEGSSSNN
ncbi:hypothetical protein M9Y10_033519 [Tritrichomonas musculus]|uniref:PAS fold domain-containing protein n=1 Tax=Tritrichomonas musculus TaxID=1915356 RepID=A0ABR2KCD9_9EUKA